MNRTIKLLMISDVLILTGFGLMQPILAIFINDGVSGGGLLSAGLASTLFLVTKSLVQLPFSRHIDRTGNKTKWLLIGTILISLVPIIYIFVQDIIHVYIAECLYGIGSGLAYPSWVALWSTNLKPGDEGFEWSIYSTSTGLGAAATAAIGAVLANTVGFVGTFVMTSLMCILGSGVILFLENEAMRDKTKADRDDIGRDLEKITNVGKTTSLPPITSMD